ncbi:MAG: zinc ribbon domain-containing protein [Marinobacterium sp.]|nr:zinc ribbon domain-containing protein [Marinobacterium sp.]
MALVDCPECSKQVSESAFKCTHCGFQIRKPKRGIMGKLFKWSFILFNLFMLFWLFSFFGAAGEIAAQDNSSAHQAGAAIGATIGTGVLVSLWVCGDIILGLLVMFTRPKNS